MEPQVVHRTTAAAGFRKIELTTLVLVDFCMFSIAWGMHYMIRHVWQWFGEPTTTPQTFWLPMVMISLFWLVLFLFSGMYRERFAESRFDELVSIVKVVTVGILILFFALFIRQLEAASAQQIIAIYWGAMIGFVATGRMVLRSIQKALVTRGIGAHRALIVGWNGGIEELYREVARYPAAGLKVVGAARLMPSFVPAGHGEDLSPYYEPTLGEGEELEMPEVLTLSSVDELPELIEVLNVQDVLLVLDSGHDRYLMDILQVCDGLPVRLKLVPDFYHVVAGMARTEHVYGLPLVEVLPVPMPVWEQSTKRLIDLIVSLTVLMLGFPLWLILGVLVRVTSPGPAIYRQRRVGQHGEAFTMYKFRTMRNDAEKNTGPVWASANDPRYTPIGQWLRKMRLDEVPQLWNVLKGEMSLVGPRPERPYFVDRLAQEIPLYNRRHRVKPGITGLAQVKWKYDTSIEDVRQKVKYDLFYIENMSLRMDFKILFQTIRTALLGQGQ